MTELMGCLHIFCSIHITKETEVPLTKIYYAPAAWSRTLRASTMNNTQIQKSTIVLRTVQPSSRKSSTPTVPKVNQIGPCGVLDTDLELFFNSWSAGF